MDDVTREILRDALDAERRTLAWQKKQHELAQEGVARWAEAIGQTEDRIAAIAKDLEA